MRTVRVRNVHETGTLARLLASISSMGASVGSIEMLTETAQSVVRDITVYAEDAEHMDHVIETMRVNIGTHILEVRDEVLELHQKGKIAIRSRFPIDSVATLRRVYTPGVAEVCLKIADDPELAWLYTCISHMVAIVTDGTAVLGLGDIGPLAGMPVMEGKAMLMETLVGLSGMPILLNTKDTEQIIEAVVAIAPTFAAIQLEDISAPRCFEIEERLQAMLDIPVMHDDQHGTAVVTTAALMVIARRAGVDIGKVVIGQIGLGAAGYAIAKMLMRLTGNPVLGTDLNEEALQRFERDGGKRSNLKEIMAECRYCHCHHRCAGSDQAGDGAQGTDHPGALQSQAGDRPGSGPGTWRGLCRGWKIGQQCAGIPRHLPRRGGCACAAHHARNADRRGACARAHDAQPANLCPIRWIRRSIGRWRAPWPRQPSSRALPAQTTCRTWKNERI